MTEKILVGPNLGVGSIKGKTAGREPEPMVSDQIDVPSQLREDQESLELCLNTMFVNRMPFPMTMTRNLH